jgi:hypothetical protein
MDAVLTSASVSSSVSLSLSPVFRRQWSIAVCGQFRSLHKIRSLQGAWLRHLQSFWQGLEPRRNRRNPVETLQVRPLKPVAHRDCTIQRSKNAPLGTVRPHLSKLESAAHRQAANHDSIPVALSHRRRYP